MDKRTFLVLKRGKKIEVDDIERLAFEEARDKKEKEVWIKNKKIKISDVLEIREEGAEGYIDKLQREWKQNCKKRLGMSPLERAENTKGHFGLWFWGVYGKNPSDEVWQKARVAIQKFYEKNPDLIYPFIRFYFNIVKGSKERKMNENALRILERIEENLVYFHKNRAVDNSVLTKLKQGV